MPLVKKFNENQFSKINTGADYIRPTPVLRDRLHKVSADDSTSCVIVVGFYFNMGMNELEVYNNEQKLLRANDYVEGDQVGNYTELNNYSILFNEGEINEGDILRFRLTSNGFDRSDINTNNMQQTSRDLYGRLDQNVLQNSGESIAPHPIVVSTFRSQPVGGSYLNEHAIDSVLNLIGSNETAIHFTKGVWNVNSLITIPSNVTCIVDDGVEFRSNTSPAIIFAGVVLSGAYQIFYGANNDGKFIVNSFPRDMAWWGNEQELIVNKLNAGEIVGGIEDAKRIVDDDQNTWVDTDFTGTDENAIRFATNGVQVGIINSLGNWIIGGTSYSSPPEKLLIYSEMDDCHFKLSSFGGAGNSEHIELVERTANTGWRIIHRGNVAVNPNHFIIANNTGGVYRNFFHIDPTSTSIPRFLFTGATNPNIQFRRISDSVSNGNTLANLEFSGMISSSVSYIGAQISSKAVENWSTGVFGTELIFSAASPGAGSALTESVKINSNGIRVSNIYPLTDDNDDKVNVYLNRDAMVLHCDYTFGAGIGLFKTIDDLTDVKQDDWIGYLAFAAQFRDTTVSRSASMITTKAGVDWWVGDSEFSYCPSDMIFLVRSYTDVFTPTERMRIKYNGYVGIGTDDPQDVLDVNGGIRLGFTNNEVEGIIRYANSTYQGWDGTAWVVLSGGTGGSGITVWNKIGNTVFYTAGQVAVGSQNPHSSAKFEIADSFNSPALTFKRIDSSIVDDENLGIINFSGSAADSISPTVSAQIMCKAHESWGANTSSSIRFNLTAEDYGTITENCFSFFAIRQPGAGERYGQLLINKSEPVNYQGETSLGGISLVVGSYGTGTQTHPKEMLLTQTDINAENRGIGELLFAGITGGTDREPQIGAGIRVKSTSAWSSEVCPSAIEFFTVPSGGSTLTRAMTIGQNGKVFIGNTINNSPPKYLSINTSGTPGGIAISQVSGFNPTDDLFSMSCYGSGSTLTGFLANYTGATSTTVGPMLRFFRARNTQASPAILGDGDLLANIEFRGRRTSGSPGNDHRYVQISSITAEGGLSSNLWLRTFQSDGINTLGSIFIGASNGYVGIGTGNASPVQMLDVGGGIRLGNTSHGINGSIRYSGGGFQGCRAGSWVNLDNDGIRLGITTFGSGHGIPSVAAATTVFLTNNSGEASIVEITDFVDGSNGQVFTVIVKDDKTRFIHGDNIKLQGTGNFTADENDTIQFMKDNTGVWYEVSRSVNS